MLQVILGLLTSVALAGDPYEDLKMEADFQYPEQALVVRGKTIKYKPYIRSSEEVPEDYLRETIRISSELSLDYIGYLYKERCDRRDYLELYEVSFVELNVPGYIVDKSIKGFGSIWGYFDPRDSKVGFDSIVIANHTYKTNHVIFAHEIAHYWYERLCISLNSNATSSEDFARSIEAMYTTKLNGK